MVASNQSVPREATMDPRIENLETTTFLGKRLTRRQIAVMQETVALFPNDSRRELARTLCENFDWHTPSGSYREQFCLRVLERLGVAGHPDLAGKARDGRSARASRPHRSRRTRGAGRCAAPGSGAGHAGGRRRRSGAGRMDRACGPATIRAATGRRSAATSRISSVTAAAAAWAA